MEGKQAGQILFFLHVRAVSSSNLITAISFSKREIPTGCPSLSPRIGWWARSLWIKIDKKNTNQWRHKSSCNKYFWIYQLKSGWTTMSLTFSLTSNRSAGLGSGLEILWAPQATITSSAIAPLEKLNLNKRTLNLIFYSTEVFFLIHIADNKLSNYFIN